MAKSLTKSILYLSLIFLFFIHNDLWYWNDAALVLGLPIGLLYHVGFCAAASLLLWGLVVRAWPDDLEMESTKETDS